MGQLTHQQKGTANVYLAYDVSGKVIAIYGDAAHTQLQLSYVYDEAGIRIKKINHSQNITTYYVPDASGNLMAIYDNNGTALAQKEIPVYAASRIGMFNRTNSSYQYELTDHLGNVRVVLNQNKIGGLADVAYYSDYYPYGSPLTLANNDYRYGYQGQYAEKDKETTWNAFELRNYDAAIGRWLSIDPYGQYASPYLGMGNNPVSIVDPDGGFSKDPKFPENPANLQVYNEGGKDYIFNNGQWSNYIRDFNVTVTAKAPMHNFDRTFEPYMPSAIGFQLSVDVNSIFVSGSIGFGYAFNTRTHDVSEFLSVGAGPSIEPSIPGLSIGGGVFVVDKLNDKQPFNLNDALGGIDASFGAQIGPVGFQQAQSLLENKPIINGRLNYDPNGYKTMGFSLGAGFKYSTNLSYSNSFTIYHGNNLK